MITSGNRSVAWCASAFHGPDRRRGPRGAVESSWAYGVSLVVNCCRYRLSEVLPVLEKAHGARYAKGYRLVRCAARSVPLRGRDRRVAEGVRASSAGSRDELQREPGEAAATDVTGRCQSPRLGGLPDASSAR